MQSPAAVIENMLSDPEQNGLGVLRLALAMLVLISHAFAVGGFGDDPLEIFSGGTISLGSMAVQGFFAISGYLVSQSWDRLRGARAYLLRRALRLFPGYWLCLVISAAFIVPTIWYMQHGSLSAFGSAEPSAWGYVWRNFALMRWQGTIGDVASDQIFHGVFNLSLWTLPHEFVWYVALLFIACLGGLRKRGIWPGVVLIALLLNYALDPSHDRFLGRLQMTAPVVRLPIYFATGVVWWCWADHLKVAAPAWLAVVAIVVVATAFGQYHWVMPFCMAAILFPLASAFRTPRFLVTRDYSYGVYLYGIPVERVLAALKLSLASPWVFCLLATALVLPFAILSWHLCEGPALKLRSRRIKSPS